MVWMARLCMRPVQLVSSLNMEQKQARPRIQSRGNPRSIHSHSVVDESGQPAPWASSSPELSNARHYDGCIPTRVEQEFWGKKKGGGGEHFDGTRQMESRCK